MTVADHLQSGKVRTVFVAHVIPPEMPRIIEFLNEHTPAIDVLGVDLNPPRQSHERITAV